MYFRGEFASWYSPQRRSAARNKREMLRIRRVLEKRVVIVDEALTVVSPVFVGGVLDMVAMLSRDCRDCKAIGSGLDGLYVLSSGWNRRGFEV